MIKSITSRTHPEIQEVAKLSTTKERHAQKKFIAEGQRVIETILARGIKPHMMYATHEWLTIIESFNLPEKYFTHVSPTVMAKISQSSSPSGLLAVFPINYGDLKQINEPGIVLVQVHDPGNTGTLMRTCGAMNKKNFIVVEGVDPWHPKVVQASAGTIAYLNIIRCTWQELIQHKTLPLAALVVRNGKSLDQAPKNILLVVGGEAFGIPQDWLAQCEQHYTLNMPGSTESLNAAIAGSIALYVVWSQKKA